MFVGSLLRFVRVAFVVFTAMFFTQAAYAQKVDGQLAPIELVTVTTAKGAFKFSTEIAKTPMNLQRGLMFRHRLPQDRAMMFDWGRDIVANMWMKNTIISLDMIFISRQGIVTGFKTNTVPKSLDVISSGIPIAAVLEVVAGTVERIGLKRGDLVSHPMFNR